MKKWSVNFPVPMDGTCNFRDLGGYPANGGTIKKGCFYRSDALHRLSEDDLSWMEEKEITLDYLDSTWGNAETYLKECGVNAEDLEKLKKILVE